MIERRTMVSRSRGGWKWTQGDRPRGNFFTEIFYIMVVMVVT